MKRLWGEEEASGLQVVKPKSKCLIRHELQNAAAPIKDWGEE